ncbi:hypothetical protein [Kitasatospora sp. NPDC059599]|uniref:hypothetical protein n=1 Tax=Kitasatospora sp. NPDC059599 TaxID=3346880 RepID=UPI00369D5D3A
MSVKKPVRTSVRAAAWCALLLVAPLALAQPAAAVTSSTVTSSSGDNGPRTPEEAAACKSVTSALLGGFGSMLGNAVCVVKPAAKG